MMCPRGGKGGGRQRAQGPGDVDALGVGRAAEATRRRTSRGPMGRETPTTGESKREGTASPNKSPNKKTKHSFRSNKIKFLLSMNLPRA